MYFIVELVEDDVMNLYYAEVCLCSSYFRNGEAPIDFIILP